MPKPFYTSAAIRDLEEILAFIAQDKPNAATEWVEKIEAKCLLIASSPEIGEAMPRLGAGVRANSIGRYIIFHRFVSNRLEILRVLPGERNITSL
ncbi:type II toxin-antitoxin system RelE/ParE family toxin [Candidatus Laterigemmans baculatus]|uniref:type II toxin-antitoxin system RelE/ParE family toxin n=1 Tax=Candidatus Laterigemmans baculatus TaxID=2770505 RepID=UPI0013D902B4|nr:type II toxin-antitoxin system RelE/ParE family toxin [Candidatus Laterigemmans baculatus]